MGILLAGYSGRLRQLRAGRCAEPPKAAVLQRSEGVDLVASLLTVEQARALYERKLREICSDEQWAVYHRRLYPELYPVERPGFWTRLRAVFKP